MQKILCLVAACLSGAIGHAQTVNNDYSCSGRVQQVTADRNGIVNASFEFTSGAMIWQDVCSLSDNTVFNINTAACKGVFALLTTANQTQKPVQMWFRNASGGSCTHPAWRNLTDMGWYWGPSIKDQ